MTEEKLSKEEAEKRRKNINNPGVLPGEGSGPSEATPGGATDRASNPPDSDSAATGAGDSGGAPADTSSGGGSDAVGAGGSGGAE